jgi:hypothetical protein
MFAGRTAEVKQFEQALFQTRAGQPKHFMITGERGIGKTSLLIFLKFMAEGAIPLNETTFNFLVIETDIDSSTSPLGLVNKIELGLRNKLGETEPSRKFFQDAWGFLQKVEAFGVNLGGVKDAINPEILQESFAFSLAKTVSRLTETDETRKIFSSTYDGVLILIDESDNASKSLSLGSFMKLLLERLQRNNCNNLMVTLAGLPDLRDILRDSHQSSLRLFDEIALGPLLDGEVNFVLNCGLKKANTENTTPTQITEEARVFLARLSQGYPHFVQQFGYSSFDHDSDYLIDMNDAISGAFNKKPRGAIELIGDRYYHSDFYKKIQKDSYRQVLRIMANELDDWVTKKEIRKQFKGKGSTLNNAIRALLDRHIIFPKEGERGIYRLQHRAFALWIKLCATDPQKIQGEIGNGQR